jgi:hypothetical protein
MSRNQYIWKSIVENYETYQEWQVKYTRQEAAQLACVTYTERITSIFERTVLMEVYYSSDPLSRSPKTFQRKMIQTHTINILYHTQYCIVASCCTLPFIINLIFTVLCATIHQPKNLKFLNLKVTSQHVSANMAIIRLMNSCTYDGNKIYNKCITHFYTIEFQEIPD